MVKLKFLHTCDLVIIGTDNKASFINVFNNIFATNAPAELPTFYIVSGISSDKIGKYRERIEIVSEKSGKVIAFVEDIVEIATENGNNNFVINFPQVIFDAFGKYFIKVMIDGENINKYEENYILVEPVPTKN